MQSTEEKNNLPGISAKEVSKYFGSFAALDSVSASFAAGKMYVLAGPNGAGKTTLLRVIAGLDTPSGGKVELSGSSSPGVMMQESFLYRALTPRENLNLYARLAGAPLSRVQDVTEIFDLGPFVDHEVATLSHGQRQRTSLARAALADPEILILDEPFLGLDAASVAHVLKYLDIFKGEGRLALVATHELDIVKGIADGLLVLEAGHVKYFDRFNV